MKPSISVVIIALLCAAGLLLIRLRNQDDEHGDAAKKTVQPAEAHSAAPLQEPPRKPVVRDGDQRKVSHSAPIEKPSGQSAFIPDEALSAQNLEATARMYDAHVSLRKNSYADPASDENIQVLNTMVAKAIKQGVEK